MTLVIESGIEHRVSSSNAIVSLCGKLPFYQELRTSSLLNVLIIMSKQRGKESRKRINRWL